VWASLLALDVFVPVLSLVSFLRSCWRFFFPSVFRLVPFSVAVRFLVVVFLLLFGNFCLGALPCGDGGVRGGVVLCSFPLFLPS
jgi:hypothetical protein